LYGISESGQVRILDVTPIATNVARDLIRTSKLGHHGRSDGVWVLRLPRLSERGNMVDIYAETSWHAETPFSL